MIKGSPSKEITLIVYYPHINHMLDATKESGRSKGDLLKWLGIVLAEMLCLPFDEWGKDNGVADELDPVLKDYRDKIYLVTLIHVRVINPSSIRKLRLLADGSLALRLGKDNNDNKETYTKPVRYSQRTTCLPESILPGTETSSKGSGSNRKHGGAFRRLSSNSSKRIP